MVLHTRKRNKNHVRLPKIFTGVETLGPVVHASLIVVEDHSAQHCDMLQSHTHQRSDQLRSLPVNLAARKLKHTSVPDLLPCMTSAD